MAAFLSFVTNKVKVPLMIDSTDEAVIREALTYSQGKAIINSINLEDGEERFEAFYHSSNNMVQHLLSAPLMRRVWRFQLSEN